MVASHRLGCVTAIALPGLMFSTPSDATSPHQEIQVSFALVLRDAEPAAGTVTCNVGEQCRFTAGDGSVRLVFLPKTHGLTDTFSMECTPSCSFASGRSSMEISEATRQPIEIYAGEELRIETQLVLRPRKLLGTVKLILRRN